MFCSKYLFVQQLQLQKSCTSSLLLRSCRGFLEEDPHHSQSALVVVAHQDQTRAAVALLVDPQTTKLSSSVCQSTTRTSRRFQGNGKCHYTIMIGPSIVSQFSNALVVWTGTSEEEGSDNLLCPSHAAKAAPDPSIFVADARSFPLLLVLTCRVVAFLSSFAQEPSEVGVTGLIWLFVSYGFVLYQGSNLISEGSELLLLVPELAGLVGGVILPLLGAVPDGAIIFFSGLGDIATAQETLQVGVGALAGSTIMLLTIPFSLSVLAGRVDVSHGQPNYFGQPKLDHTQPFASQLFTTGVTITDAVQHGGVIMMLTTIPYLLIQIPASFMHGPSEVVAEHERWYALSGLLVCLFGLVWYMRLQLQLSRAGEDRGKRLAVVKKLLQQGQVSLSGAVAAKVRAEEHKSHLLVHQAATEYQSVGNNNDVNHPDHPTMYPPPAVATYLKEILGDAYAIYDKNNDGQLDRREVLVFFRDFHEAISEEECDNLFTKFDVDNSGAISFDEFIGLAYTLIKAKDSGDHLDGSARGGGGARRAILESAFEQEEAEEVPEEFTSMPPDQQQAAIKKRAFAMLFLGTVLVLFFSDPMVDVMQEIANRIGLAPFYVSFILAPLASNASEVISSMYYASKKTRKTITVSLSTLCGAAALNNTFCLSIFFFLIYFRGLAWQFTAETIAIVTVELILGILVQKSSMTTFTGVLIMTIFPLSLVLVATMEAFGFD